MWIPLATTGPGARDSHALAWHERSNRVVLFGGRKPGEINDTWVWDGARWASQAVATPPVPRSRHAMTSDFQGGPLLMLGGGSWLEDPWEWDGASWWRVRMFGYDGPSVGFALVRTSSQTLLSGGSIDRYGTVFADVWVAPNPRRR